MSASTESQARTRAFARVLGPFFFIVPAAIAVRAAEMGAILADFAARPIWAWVLGTILLASGLVILAFHQYWRGAAAVAISLLGWFLFLRGVILLFAPQWITRGAGSAMGAPALVRTGFAAVSLVGLWLTWVGWRPRRT